MLRKYWIIIENLCPVAKKATAAVVKFLELGTAEAIRVVIPSANYPLTLQRYENCLFTKLFQI